MVALCKVLLGALDGNSNVEALCFGILKGQVFLQTEVYSHFIPPHPQKNILLYYVMPIPLSYLTCDVIRHLVIFCFVAHNLLFHIQIYIISINDFILLLKSIIVN